MKNYKIIIYILFGLLFSNCDEDFLDKQPLDQVSSQTFWNSEADALLGLVGVYSRLQSGSFGFDRYNLDCLTDNARNMHNHDGVIGITEGQIQSNTGGMVSGIYANAYRGIATCNIFLKNVEDIEMDAGVKSKYIAEVKFIRAWFYFNLQQIYGDVMIYKTPVTVEESIIKQSTSDEVLAFIHQDLDDAIADLPDLPYGGSVVKNSALALKAKVYLHTEKWAEAAEQASLVLSSGNTSLSNDYTGLFITTGQDSNPNEILFSTRYLAPNNTMWYQIQVGWWTSPNPRQELADAYQCTDGLSIGDSPLYDPLDPYANRDPRLIQSIQVEPWYINGELIVQEFTSTGLIVQKGIDKTIGPLGYGVESDNDFIHLRYADVLLMYAEAKNETSGPDGSVYDAINEVRSRVGVDMPELPAGLSKDDMRDHIRLERQIELAFEGHRYFDLKRWRIIPEVMAAIDEPGKGTGSLLFKPNHYNWPFPEGDMDLNPELDQKQGY